MAQARLYPRQREALMSWSRLRADRETTIASLQSSYGEQTQSAEREWKRQHKKLTSERDEELNRLDSDWQQSAAELQRWDQETEERIHQQDNQDRAKLQQTYLEEREALATALQDTRWTLDSLLEAGRKEAEGERDRFLRQLRQVRKRSETIWTSVQPAFEKVNLVLEDPEEESKVSHELPESPKAEDLEEALAGAETLRRDLMRQMLLRCIALPVVLTMLLVMTVSGAIVGQLAGGNWRWIVAGGVSGLCVGLVLHFLVRALARQQTSTIAEQLRDNLARTLVFADALDRVGQEACDRQIAALTHRHQVQLEEARRQQQPVSAQIDYRQEIALEQLDTRYQDQLASHRREADQRRAQMESRSREQRTERAQYHQARLDQAEQHYRRRMDEATALRDHGLQALEQRWSTGLSELRHSFTEFTTFALEQFPSWQRVDGEQLPERTQVPAGIAFGELALMDGHFAQEGLPLFFPFPDQGAVLLKASGLGQRVAIPTMQAMMLRLLTALPPGKVRFTIIDPVGLGENFASFMHLADFDELLVNHRIWTEPSQIEQRLTDLTEHMETVIQKYLRNQYRDIDDYNRAAGEVAEPYRVLVIAHFPVNFTQDAARRLVSILNSGPACGVFTLIHVDPKQPLPRDFRLAELEQHAWNFLWKEDHFESREAPFSEFAITLEPPPPPDRLAAIVQTIGERSKDARRVEVPFAYVCPEQAQIWQSDSRHGIRVPIGRAGATRRQYLALGQGTAQHALIAGKTGSGKSTLLHALITSLSLHYAPDEVELYLIDFKKGVEFKAYANQHLPHARVVAIESEREFGISVLQRLDVELRERGDRFRAAGVNDIADFRDRFPEERCPRILLIVDEFQEFFVEDDRQSQEAALLLDRLVRQGRAFGLHVLLGSQTLGGAYSLARSTIDQMGIRIALQCSEADAQLILNKDNSAARLLTRPGEAIYNDANGAIEGNDLFQVVWLDDATRQQALEVLRERDGTPSTPIIIFEGNLPAELANNTAFRELLARPRPTSEPTTGTAWLGEPVAIKPPTAASFRPMTASNLLIIGQHEEAARAMLMCALLGLAAQQPANGTPSFYLLDGTPADEPYAAMLRELSERLGDLCQWLERPQLGDGLSRLVDELKLRQEDPHRSRIPRYLLIHGMHQFRDLRKAEDDFGFGRRDESRKSSPSELLLNLVREGPIVGMHSWLWCDSLTNTMRSIDRPTLREFSMRVLFQMSAADSSHLIDTPMAARLGRHRALFHHEDQGRLEKFRPYDLPGKRWLEEVLRQLKPDHQQVYGGHST